MANDDYTVDANGEVWCGNLKMRFLVEPGRTRPATAEDIPYLQKLDRLKQLVMDGDPGENNEE